VWDCRNVLDRDQDGRWHHRGFVVVNDEQVLSKLLRNPLFDRDLKILAQHREAWHVRGPHYSRRAPLWNSHRLLVRSKITRGLKGRERGHTCRASVMHIQYVAVRRCTRYCPLLLVSIDRQIIAAGEVEY